MFNFGFFELLLVAAACIVFLKPKDIPVLLRHVSKFMRELREVTGEFKAEAASIMEESGAREMNSIIDLEGNEQQAYDVRDLDSLKK